VIEIEGMEDERRGLVERIVRAMAVREPREPESPSVSVALCAPRCAVRRVMSVP
jgi:hypothetical protein